MEHIVPVYNAHTSYQVKNPAHYTTLNTVIKSGNQTIWTTTLVQMLLFSSRQVSLQQHTVTYFSEKKICFICLIKYNLALLISKLDSFHFKISTCVAVFSFPNNNFKSCMSLEMKHIHLFIL